MSYISPFAHINKTKTAIFGGKAASLGEMKGIGLPIPDGFAISADACRDFADGKLSEEFQQELQTAFKRLGAKRVAVRSSAIAEDAGDASWAGQLESYLNVGQEDLLRSVQNCWDSIKSEHALDYAKDKSVSKEDLMVGVVVQEMIDSEVSGVMFTVDPVSQEQTNMMVEAVYGLGEMIVQGVVTPDHWIVTKKPFGVVEFQINVKEKQMVFAGGKNVVKDLPEAVADKATLREEQVEEIAKIGLWVEKHYGKPQDIEWAYQNGKFYVVQSRPITTLS